MGRSAHPCQLDLKMTTGPSVSFPLAEVHLTHGSCSALCDSRDISNCDNRLQKTLEIN